MIYVYIIFVRRFLRRRPTNSLRNSMCRVVSDIESDQFVYIRNLGRHHLYTLRNDMTVGPFKLYISKMFPKDSWCFLWRFSAVITSDIVNCDNMDPLQRGSSCVALTFQFINLTRKHTNWVTQLSRNERNPLFLKCRNLNYILKKIFIKNVWIFEKISNFSFTKMSI